MTFSLLVLVSLVLQCGAVWYSCRLIRHTGHARAWGLLASGIATMAVRRFLTLIALPTAPKVHGLLDYGYEGIGLLGAGLMLAGVIAIRPFFAMLRESMDRQRALADNLQEALNNIKLLKGLLPICSHCKKIRDDAGYWQPMESYISSHSETKFSHGICPDCAQRLYPEVYERMQAEKAQAGG